MSLKILQTGIDAVNAGKHREGARLLRIALKSGELNQQFQAVAHVALAQTSDDAHFKADCYRNALALDPDNQEARQRLAHLLTSRLGAEQPPSTMPPTDYPSPTSAPPYTAVPNPTPSPGRVPYAAGAAPPVSNQPIVGIIGGPNGPGTAVFVHQEGILATTRYVVGGMEQITVDFGAGQQETGWVVRAFPEMDVALLRVNQQIYQRLPITPHPRVPDEMPLLLRTFSNTQIKGRQRPSKRVMASHWISTDFRELPDAGGAALFDEHNYLSGIMTKNNSRASGYLYGVHITAIQRCIEHYLREIHTGERRSYCPGCGYLSRSMGAGFFYCELCGSVAPQAGHFQRYAQQNPYFESSPIRCTNCGAQVGYGSDGRCLRCGQTPLAPSMKP